MRSEREMLELILSTARSDSRVRAVVLNGSRVNPNAPRDCFQDFDVVYVVTEVASFVADQSWVARFGELMILQTPDAMGDARLSPGDSFAYLMQFADGNRIDLTLLPTTSARRVRDDGLSRLLLDKDGVVGPLRPPSDVGYVPTPPSAREFSDCCNEFWWVCTYVAKGLWRGEIVYAKHMLESCVRRQLMKALRWFVGTRSEWRANPGQSGRYLQRHLPAEVWSMLLATYSDSSSDHTWDALLATADLFRLVAGEVSEDLGFEYPRGDDERVSAHLEHVRGLPRDASEVYPT